MPEPAARPMISRRAALRAVCSAALLAVAGCRPSGSSADVTGKAPATGNEASAANHPSLGANAALAQRIGDDEQALITAYDDAIGAHPELAALLAPLRGDHVKHLLALVPGAPTSGAPTSSTPSLTPSVAAGPPSSPSGSGAAGPPTSPASSRPAVLEQLGSLEQQAAAARVDDVMSSAGSLARLLASIGGCEAAHAALLQGAAQ